MRSKKEDFSNSWEKYSSVLDYSQVKKCSGKVIFNLNTCCYLFFGRATSLPKNSEIVKNRFKKERKKIKWQKKKFIETLV